MDNMIASGSTLDSSDAYHIEHLIQDWLEDSRANPDHFTKNQSKIQGAVTILKQIDNIEVIVERENKHDISNVTIKIVDKLQNEKENSNGTD